MIGVLQVQQFVDNDFAAEGGGLVEEGGVEGEVAFRGATGPFAFHRADGDELGGDAEAFGPGTDFGFEDGEGDAVFEGGFQGQPSFFIRHVFTGKKLCKSK